MLLHSQNELQTDKDIFNRNVVVSETDLDGIITYVNDNYCKLSGFTKEELEGNTHKTIRHEGTNPQIYKEL